MPTTSTRLQIAGRNGIRFEHCAAVPPAPDGAEYRVLLPLRARAADGRAFTDWQQG